MKVAWFTPFSIKSAIGRYSKFATSALLKYADVDIFVADQEKLHETDCNIIFYDDLSVCTKLSEYDVVVYNIGDNAKYHSKIYEILLHYPGVIINHDVSLHNLMRCYYLTYKKNEEEFKELLISNYGREMAKELWRIGSVPGEYAKLDFRKYSLSEQIGNYALGMIVHSEYHKKHIENFYKGKLAVITLLDMNDGLLELDPNIVFNGYSGNRTHILTVGNVNENKRIHTIIKVLGENKELAEAFDFTIIGSKSNTFYYKYLEKLVAKYGLEKQVRFLGFVDHKRLAYYYNGADIISNLRFPAFEGASGSIVEQLCIGKACIVSDTGVYSEIDDNAVIKINPMDEEQELKDALYFVWKNKDSIKEIEDNARKYASKSFDRNLYARKLYMFLKEVTFTKPILELSDYCSDIFKDMPSVMKTNIPEKVVAEIEEIFCL